MPKKISGVVRQQPTRDKFIDRAEDQVRRQSGTDVTAERTHLLALLDNVAHPVQILAEFTTRKQAHESSRMTGFDLKNVGQVVVSPEGFEVQTDHYAEFLNRILKGCDLFIQAFDKATQNAIED